MKITIYELLGIVKDGKAPKSIFYDGEDYVFNIEENTYVCCDHDLTLLFNEYNMKKIDFLNDVVEITDIKYLYDDLGGKLIKPFLEEKKIPEKLNLDTYATIGTEVDKDVIIKINEIIDALEMLNDKIK